MIVALHLILQAKCVVFMSMMELQGKCGKSVQHVLEGAGHWVHFDAADQLCNMFLASFQRVESASAMKS